MTTIEGFQSREDVEEYLNNLGIEYRFQCYSERRPDGCHRLGEFLEAVRNDYEKAAVVFQQNCDANNFTKSCFKFANYKIVGRGCTSDRQLALQYHKQACAGGHPVGCYQAGVLQLGEHGLERNLPEARKYLHLGCEKDDSESCFLLSTNYLNAQRDDAHPVNAEDDAKAFYYTKRACDLNHMYACANLHQMYKKAIGCGADEEAARMAKKKAIALRDLYRPGAPSIVFGEQ
ncbi:cytochrome c oxidase assembly factor 7 homolog [Paramacrobiotus metropolitanus]|uniref:cytochrome c oxidase assembly factor 7 homolog n=1 Tax=Paramacrobiotus metropolitanus TaxID=2943436 RepID=UPI0024464611|nr:cytochrome c oxidase assembly factor 7 homolog [Paramacrobiotus metropolitanus]XP_055337714.1 cytochrome c oxidase assembly factor 7 homolog [Paramacrobiotus metropolitanus]